MDTIALHDMMGILRPIFANPEICKVIHLAYNKAFDVPDC